MTYYIASHPTTEGLSETVNDLLAHGWRLYGDMVCDPLSKNYYQVLVR